MKEIDELRYQIQSGRIVPKRIHPFDVSAMLADGEDVLVLKVVENFIVVKGRVYRQTVTVPAKTKSKVIKGVL